MRSYHHDSIPSLPYQNTTTIHQSSIPKTLKQADVIVDQMNIEFQYYFLHLPQHHYDPPFVSQPHPAQHYHLSKSSVSHCTSKIIIVKKGKKGNEGVITVQYSTLYQATDKRSERQEMKRTPNSAPRPRAAQKEERKVIHGRPPNEWSNTTEKRKYEEEKQKEKSRRAEGDEEEIM